MPIDAKGAQKAMELRSSQSITIRAEMISIDLQPFSIVEDTGFLPVLA